MEQEEWSLWSARAIVLRCGAYVVIELRGVLTAPGYEALHRRMSLETSACTLIIGLQVLLAVTNVSAVEAAVRGLTEGTSMKPAKLLVPAIRMPWAREHCRIMALEGFSMRASALPEPSRIVLARMTTVA